MPTLAAVNEYARAQNQIVELARRDIRALRTRIGLVEPMEAKRILLVAWPALVETYGSVAQSLAGEWVESILGRPAVLGEMPPRGQLEATTRYGLEGHFNDDPDLTWMRLANELDRFIKAAARRTIMDSSYQAGVRWARVPIGETCAWCLMLGSRGYVYLSAKSAGELDDWHNDCDCQPTPDDGTTPEGYDPDALYDAYNEAAYQALGNSPRSGKAATSAILAQMRRTLPVRDRV